MDLDPNNPVVKLCHQGMQAEYNGQPGEARRLFQQAWQIHQNDLEACIAAHYLARQQDDPQQTLHWNVLALEHAQKYPTGLETFMPSLYLNLGWSYEQLGQTGQAESWYRRAGQGISILPAGGYRDTVEQGLRNGLQRIAAAGEDIGS